MSSPKGGGEIFTMHLPEIEGPELHGRSGVLGTPSPDVCSPPGSGVGQDDTGRSTHGKPDAHNGDHLPTGALFNLVPQVYRVLRCIPGLPTLVLLVVEAFRVGMKSLPGTILLDLGAAVEILHRMILATIARDLLPRILVIHVVGVLPLVVAPDIIDSVIVTAAFIIPRLLVAVIRVVGGNLPKTPITEMTIPLAADMIEDTRIGDSALAQGVILGVWILQAPLLYTRMVIQGN